MGITWCRERLEQAQNSKNPVDRILIRCSNVMKPKTYNRSQDRLADDIVYRGVRTKDLGNLPPGSIWAPPRARNRLSGTSDWQACSLVVPDVAPIPPPRKKRKRKMNGDVSVNGLQQTSSNERKEFLENKENIPQENGSPHETPSKDVRDQENFASSNEQRRQNRFIKVSEHRARKIKTDFHPSAAASREEKQRNDYRKREHKIKVVKNVSTVSLPNYNELIKPAGKVSADAENADDKMENPSGDRKPPRRIQSTVSLPGEGSNSILSSLSEATIHRLETYMKRCRSFGSLKPQQLLEKLEEFNKNQPRSESESSDSWSGLDDWDLGVIEYCDPETANVPPLRPKSTLPPKSKTGPMFSVGSPQETPRRQSPVTAYQDDGDDDYDENEPVTEAAKRSSCDDSEKVEINIQDNIYDSILTPENVPSDWFSASQKTIIPSDHSKLDVEKQKYTRTPPPSPESGLPADETVIESDKSKSSLIEMLAKYGDDARVAAAADRKKSAEHRKVDREVRSMRTRSSSLVEINQNLLNIKRFNKRSPSIGCERSENLLEELSRKSRTIEKELLLDPELVLNGLRRASLRENLPEDQCDVYMMRKKPSLRESLSVFLGFDRDLGGSANNEEKSEGKDDDCDPEERPPPLPLNPPPVSLMVPPETASASAACPLVMVTCEKDQIKQ